MIKQREEEVGALGEIIRKVTHKGEVELDSTEIGEKIVEVCLQYISLPDCCVYLKQLMSKFVINRL